MKHIEEVRQGWNFMAEILGAEFSSGAAYSDYKNEAFANEQIRLHNIQIDSRNLLIDEQNTHIDKINEAIDNLADKINNHPHLNNTVGTFKGYVAEEWHAGTYNIEAIKHGSEHSAWTLQSNADGSVDIETNFGKEYSLKYYDSAEKAENAQAALFKDSHGIKYKGQERLIAAEQIEEAKYWAGRREESAKYNSEKDPAVKKNLSAAHRETAQHLVGTVSDDEGIKSKELSVKEAEKIAKEAQSKSGFDPEKHGIKKEEHIEHLSYEEEIQINYINNAFKAGLTAASITAVTQLVPELYKAIDYLIKNGEIDLNQIKRSGEKIITASGESFLRGSIAYGIEVAVQEGFFGEAIQNISPNAIGAMVTIVMGTVKNSILVAAGKMTAKEMGMKFVDTVVVSAGYLAAMKIGGIIAQAIAPEMPGLAYAIGSLLGCSVAVVYNIGKKKLISFCINTGFTCFGLVEQNYELPKEVLDELGVETIKISRAEIEKSDINKAAIYNDVEESNYETVQITMLERGMIGVNKIGYTAKPF